MEKSVGVGEVGGDLGTKNLNFKILVHFKETLLLDRLTSGTQGGFSAFS